MSKVLDELKFKLTSEIEEDEEYIERSMDSIESWKRAINNAELHITEKREKISILKKMLESLENKETEL